MFIYAGIVYFIHIRYRNGSNFRKHKTYVQNEIISDCGLLKYDAVSPGRVVYLSVLFNDAINC